MNTEKIDPIEFSFFPFLGLLENGDTFQYLWKDLKDDHAEIAIVSWLVHRTVLKIGDKINLYAPYQSPLYKQLVKNIDGVIVSSYKDEQIQGIVYQISLIKKKLHHPDKFIPPHEFIESLKTPTSLSELTIYLVKDCMVLKEGVGIYLQHLIPFFSRITNLRYMQYIKLKENLLLDILEKVQSNESNLKELHQQLKDKLHKDEDIPIHLSLEELREIVESEISVHLFDILFSDKDDLASASETRIQHNYTVTMYIDAIKNLEKRVYANFNSIVLLYLKSLSKLT